MTRDDTVVNDGNQFERRQVFHGICEDTSFTTVYIFQALLFQVVVSRSFVTIYRFRER